MHRLGKLGENQESARASIDKPIVLLAGAFDVCSRQQATMLGALTSWGLAKNCVAMEVIASPFEYF